MTEEKSLIDRLRTQLFVFREAEKLYEKNAGERVAHWQRRSLARYARNLAVISQGLAAIAVRPHGGRPLHRG